ncbi:MAG: cell wall hydrolase [Lachnospiraceae bacterium]|nr:cell wall hydrolase [Lachnospiraceae bacterium]
MVKKMKRLFSVLGRVNADTHLWCISVLGGAILLCISFFMEPSSRHLSIGSEDAAQLARQIVIEYSSVLGSLSGLEYLEHEDVEEIVEAIPDHASEDIVSELEESDILASDVIDFYEYAKNVNIVPRNEVNVDISKVYSIEAVDALERLVQCEAASEDADGRILVADVVLNRVDTGIWGDDIISVIEAPGQFNPVDNGAVKNAEVDDITKEAVMSALLGEDNSHGAIYFQKSAAKVWGDKEYLFRHGSHSFYK